MFSLKRLRISSSLSLHGIPGDDIGQFIRSGILFHKAVGFDAADFPMRYLQFMGENWKAYIETAAEDALTQGLRFEVCHLPFKTLRDPSPEELAEFQKSVFTGMDAAMILGADHAVLHPNTVVLPVEEYDEARQFAKTFAHLAPFADYAAKIGLSIAVENMPFANQNGTVHRFCGNAEELCRVADALGIGVCWDFGHGHISGLKQSNALKHIGKRLKVVHINDNFADEDLHIPPFVGTNDWRDSMEGLSAIGFEGLLNYEVKSTRIPTEARESFARYLVRIADVLRDMM